MSIAHLHLALNHVPVIGSLFVALLLAYAARRHSDDVTRAALVLAGLIGAISVAVYFTGEPAESVVERLPGFSEPLTERHEDAALVATVVVGVLGALAVLTLLVYRGARALPRRTVVSALGLALVACGVMGYTAYLGGQIRHTEIRPAASGSATPAPHGESDDR